MSNHSSSHSSTHQSRTGRLEDRERRESGLAVIVIGGHPPDRRVVGALPALHTVICADSGLDHALRLGLDPRIVIGDMDSVDPVSLAAIRERECEVHEHAVDKDSTDTELALALAVDRGFRRITVVWGGGDRIDHVLGVVAALAHERLDVLESLDAWIAADRIDIVRTGRCLDISYEPDTTISLLPIGVEDAVVTTTGLKWNLTSQRLEKDRARGLSNVLVTPPGSISCERGIIAVVTPDRLSALTRFAS